MGLPADLRQAEIQDFDLPTGRDEDVRRLNVAVHNSLAMRRLQCVCDLHGEVQ